MNSEFAVESLLGPSQGEISEASPLPDISVDLEEDKWIVMPLSSASREAPALCDASTPCF